MIYRIFPFESPYDKIVHNSLIHPGRKMKYGYSKEKNQKLKNVCNR